MTKLLAPALFAVLALSACSAFGPPKSPPGTPQRACEDAADADYSLNARAQQLTTAANPGGYGQILAALRQDSVQRCLMQKGVIPPGGVDKVRP